MEIQTMPKEAVAELLLFLAEHEEFGCVKHLLADGITVEEVRAVLREVAEGLCREASLEAPKTFDAQKARQLHPATKEVISYLSPGEEKTLLTAFGFLDKSKLSPFARTAPASKNKL